MPSKLLLRYYKNSVKQSPGFCEDNLLWMNKEMEKQNIPDFRRHGRLIIDEITIQDNLIITKSADAWNLVGFVDIGSTNNNIDIVCRRKSDTCNSICFLWIIIVYTKTVHIYIYITQAMLDFSRVILDNKNKKTVSLICSCL